MSALERSRRSDRSPARYDSALRASLSAKRLTSVWRLASFISTMAIRNESISTSSMRSCTALPSASPDLYTEPPVAAITRSCALSTTALRAGSVPNCGSSKPYSWRCLPASARKGYFAFSSLPSTSMAWLACRYIKRARAPAGGVVKISRGMTASRDGASE